MNVVLLNQFFPPALAPTGILLAELAAELVRRGHGATVIASAGGYGAGAGAPVPAGVRVVRVGPATRHRSGPAAKLADYLSFYRGAWTELAHGPRPDALVCLTTPPFVGWLGAHLRKTAGVPYALWCMDLYPEALAAHGWLRPWNPLKPLLAAVARAERRRASAVVALGPDMAEILRASAGAAVEEIPVWSDLGADDAIRAAARDLRRARGWANDEIVLLYSGNMGRAHRAEEFAALAEALSGRSPRCRFVFSGNGPVRAEWERRWGGLFEFLPPAPAGSCAAHLLAADVHLVSQRPEWAGIVVPSKFQAACALGRPVVFAGPPDAAVGRWLAEADAGWRLPPGAAAAVAATADGICAARQRAEKGAAARRLFERRFTRERNCATLAALVERIAEKRT
ncbi:MAG: glycosyltransferase family 4 protein [Kiritimatiellia bacterium]